MRSSAKRKRVGRPRTAQHRPVLSARVPQDFYERIRTSAVLNGRNASEELIWRAARCFELEADLERRLQLLRDAEKSAVEERMHQAGYTKMHASLGVAWFAPGVKPNDWINACARIDPLALQEMLDRAAMRAIEKMKETKS